jgi:hypothetical protein
MDNQPPWATYPPLTEARLNTVARLLADVRHEAVLLHDPDNGDNNWSLGCRVYVRACAALLTACSQYPEWLSVIEDTGLHFVFAIGGVPLRFYKGEPENAPSRSLKRKLPEIHAHQLALFGDERHADEILRIAVETDTNGEAETITLVQLDQEGNMLEAWPLNWDAFASVAPIAQQKEGVQQQPAKVLPFKETKKEEDENA